MRPAGSPNPSPRRWDRGGGDRLSSGSVVENAPSDSRSACSAELEDFGDLRRTLLERELAATEAADDRVCRYVLKTRSTSRSCSVTARQASRPAALSACRPRKATLTGIPITCSTRRWIRLSARR